MISNLFSIFDPSSCVFSFGVNWFALIVPLILIPTSYFILTSPLGLVLKRVKSYLLEEISPIVKAPSANIALGFVAVFVFILIRNLFGLLPYVFTPSSHILFSLSLALPLWLAFIFFGAINRTKNVLAHLVPVGTPVALMFFMVLIETVRNIIRPLTLSVRLMANITAGHIILGLISSQVPKIELLSLSLFPAQIILMLLEVGVAFIQAYVFTILLALYVAEVK